jgi:hypothetical protein
MIDFFEEEVVGDEALNRISSLAKKQLDLEDKLKDAEEEAARIKEELDHVRKELLPSAMEEVGMTMFALDNGWIIDVKQTVKGHISKKNAQEAHEWLRKNGFGSLIKNEVTVAFGKGEDEDAKAFLDQCRQEGKAAQQKEGVHAQTLGAFIREQLEEGSDIPKDLLGVMSFAETKIKRGK